MQLWLWLGVQRAHYNLPATLLRVCMNLDYWLGFLVWVLPYKMPLIAVVPVVSIGAFLVFFSAFSYNGISSVPFKIFKHQYLLSCGTFLTYYDVTRVEREKNYWILVSSFTWYHMVCKTILKENARMETTVSMFTYFLLNHAWLFRRVCPCQPLYGTPNLGRTDWEGSPNYVLHGKFIVRQS